MNPNPYLIAVYGGFVVVESYPAPDNERTITKVYTVADARSATAYPDFASADAAAKWAVNTLYPPDLRYFALLQAPTFEGELHEPN